MIIQVLHCPYCQGSDIVKHGLSSEGKQRYRCRTCLEGRGRTFLLEYSYAGQSPAVKQQIVDMAMNASGIRDTARVLHISPTTVLKDNRLQVFKRAHTARSALVEVQNKGRVWCRQTNVQRAGGARTPKCA